MKQTLSIALTVAAALANATPAFATCGVDPVPAAPGADAPEAGRLSYQLATLYHPEEAFATQIESTMRSEVTALVQRDFPPNMSGVVGEVAAASVEGMMTVVGPCLVEVAANFRHQAGNSIAAGMTVDQMRSVIAFYQTPEGQEAATQRSARAVLSYIRGAFVPDPQPFGTSAAGRAFAATPAGQAFLRLTPELDGQIFRISSLMARHTRPAVNVAAQAAIQRWRTTRGRAQPAQ
jgi:hypothetical protein